MSEPLAAAVRSGDRRALSQAITLVESTRPDHRREARTLIDELLPETGTSMRVGVSGAPGAGKSTLIEALGLDGVRQGHRVAVLAVDPSSTRSGGSILGDKTRMAELGRTPQAYIRPSPTGGTLGGVARHTREAVLLCEAAGFDVVLVETVGVGQSEVAVADLVDLFVLVASPTGGDELQGIKRGIMELADLIVVNKADGDLVDAAQRACADLRNAVHLLRPKRPGWEVEVQTCSALTGAGIDELWRAITAAHQRLRDDQALATLRAQQGVAAMWSEVTDGVLDRLRDDPEVHRRLRNLEQAVAEGRTSPTAAAQDVLDHLS
ncbi:MAG: methylmalonyl Co-A mutase-associated GTPase MeaB [Acidimicrobiales bacterium]